MLKEQNRLQQAAMQESLDEMAKQLKEANATARLESDARPEWAKPTFGRLLKA